MASSLLVIATFVFVLFAFSFGACFGSFLNVLVWRLPLGMPIIRARSHCPRCQQEILARDNIPIFGWIWLKGKCRSCQLPISVRYPLIEAAMAALFSFLFVLIVVAHGWTLPQGWIRHHLANWLTEFPGCELLVVYLHQILLGYYLLAVALIDQDRQASPPIILIVPLLGHLSLIYWNPAISQIDRLAQLASERYGTPPAASISESLLYSGQGLLLAGLLAGLFWMLCPPRVPRNGVFSCLLLGGFLGPLLLTWATLIAGSAVLVDQAVGWLQGRKSPSRVGFSLQLFWAWFFILLTWRWWPIPEYSSLMFLQMPR